MNLNGIKLLHNLYFNDLYIHWRCEASRCDVSMCRCLYPDVFFFLFAVLNLWRFLFLLQVLGYYIRNNIDTENLIKEIKSIASSPTEKYFFNVSEEAALSTIAGTLGSRIFNIEGEYFCCYAGTAC